MSRDAGKFFWASDLHFCKVDRKYESVRPCSRVENVGEANRARRQAQEDKVMEISLTTPVAELLVIMRDPENDRADRDYAKSLYVAFHTYN